jgi:hypothetical protein
MTLGLLFLVIGIVLMVLGSCGVPGGRVNMWQLGFPFCIAAYAFSGILIR